MPRAPRSAPMVRLPIRTIPGMQAHRSRGGGELLLAVKHQKVDVPYQHGRSRAWLKMRNPASPAVRREAEEDWER